MRTPEETFRALVEGVTRLQAGEPGQADALAGLYAEQTDVRHPMAPLGDTPLLTREALRAHFAAMPTGVRELAGFHADDIRVHRTGDPEVIVAEFSYRGDGGWAVPCIFVIRVRDGLIVESRDYTAHLEFAKLGGYLGEVFIQLQSA